MTVVFLTLAVLAQGGGGVLALLDPLKQPELLDLLKQPDLRASRIRLLQRVGQKVLAVVEKYKRNQLAFFDQVRVFDPR